MPCQAAHAAHRAPACSTEIHAAFDAIQLCIMRDSLPSPGCQRCSAPPARHSRYALPPAAAARRRPWSVLHPPTAPRWRHGGGPHPALTPSIMCTASCPAQHSRAADLTSCILRFVHALERRPCSLLHPAHDAQFLLARRLGASARVLNSPLTLQFPRRLRQALTTPQALGV